MKKRTIAGLAVGIAVGFSALVMLLSTKPPGPPPPVGPATLSGWVPPSLDPKPAGTASWTFQFPTAAADLAWPPVNEPHIVLNLGQPMPIHAIRLAAEPPGAFKVWGTLDDKGKAGEVVLLGEASGAEVEMVIPWRVGRKPITALRLSYVPGPATFTEVGLLDPKAIRPQSGKAYIAPAPSGVGPADDPANATRSSIAMLEDTKPLSTPHALHEHIRKLGGGRYSHWGDDVVFSASDGTDPRTNGRQYRVMKPKPHEIRLKISQPG